MMPNQPYRNVAGIALSRGLDRIEKHASLLASELEAFMSGPRADVSTQGSAVLELVRASVGRLVAAAEIDCELLAADGWQVEGKQRIVGHGGCGAG
jgi:hypothetical protein